MAHLKLFAALREAAGRREIEIEAETVGELLTRAGMELGREFSDLMGRAAIVVNGREMAPEALAGMRIGAEDEVVLLPPVSGGS